MCSYFFSRRNMHDMNFIALKYASYTELLWTNLSFLNACYFIHSYKRRMQWLICRITSKSNFFPHHMIDQATITLDDMNDNCPVFNNPDPLTLTVMENQDPRVIHIFNVTDSDIGSNRNITLFMNDTGTSFYCCYFCCCWENISFNVSVGHHLVFVLFLFLLLFWAYINYNPRRAVYFIESHAFNASTSWVLYYIHFISCFQRKWSTHFFPVVANVFKL